MIYLMKFIGLESESLVFLGEAGWGKYWGQLWVHIYCTLDCTVVLAVAWALTSLLCCLGMW